MALLSKHDNKKNRMPKKHTAGLKSLPLSIKKTYVKYMTNLGAHIFHLGRHVVYKVLKKLKTIACIVGGKFSCFFKRIIDFISEGKNKRIDKIKSYFKALNDSIAERKQKAGVFSAMRLFIATISKTIWGFKGVFVTLFNYAAPVLSIVFLVNVLQVGSSTQYAISVECNGELLGYVDSEIDFDIAQQTMQERITYVDGDNQIEVTPKLSVQKISSSQEIVTSSELADKMISTSDSEVSTAYGFYLNDEFKGAIYDKTLIENTLNRIINSYKTGASDEVVEFVDKIELREGLYLEEGMIEPSEIVDLLNSQRQVEAYYTIEKGDAPSTIAEKVGMNYADLKALNPEIESHCIIGDEVLLNRAEPFVSVRVRRTEEYDIDLPYDVIEVEDSTKYKGSETLLVSGSEGLAHISAEVSYINGYEDSRKILEQETIVEPVDRKIAVGTKSTGASVTAINNSGQHYLWPVGGDGGYISSPFGPRSGGYHYGIDIVASYGTPIYAAADGTVTKAASYTWGGGYGWHIIIDHGSGYSTLYGHCSKLAVASGTSVKKGDLIGYVGSTGHSSGNHVHFEVRYYGTKKNPMNYLG